MSSIAPYQFSQLDGAIAETKVEDVLSAAWAEAEQVRTEAYREGYTAGMTEAQAAFARDAAPALTALTEAMTGIDHQSGEIIAVLQQQAAELALAVAEQILSGVLEIDRGRVVDVCRSALRRVADRQQVTVLANPEDLEILNQAATALGVELGGIDRFEVQADRRIDRGGVVVRTDHSEIDATLTTQLARAREILMEALRTTPVVSGGDDGNDLDRLSGTLADSSS